MTIITGKKKFIGQRKIKLALLIFYTKKIIYKILITKAHIEKFWYDYSNFVDHKL